MEAIGRLSAHSTSHRFAWRGLSSADHLMTSSLHRLLEREEVTITEDALRAREQTILREARRWGLGVEGGQMVDDLQLLADLQHFGVPTRLIDVTSNPMTALWFATRDSRSTHAARSGLLVGINMSWYREESQGEGRPQTVFKTVGAPPATRGALNGGLGHRLVTGLALDTSFVVSSSVPNVRLLAQEGYFLASVHPEPPSGPMVSLKMEVPRGDPAVTHDLFANARARGNPRKLPFIAILIPSRAKKQLRTYLKNTYSRTAKRLFPDFAGFHDHGDWQG
ncbi:FRG domain-containing protein [Microbacterium sp. 22303]|uniref:FRG domain-containing protein n=1 Tax=Microbacterium sp. 22303 TaxID=3453905 RepID=UPI003F866D68